MNNLLIDRITALEYWQGPVTCAPLPGGMTNQNFIVTDGNTRFVARICEDRRFLGIERINESLCQIAAHRIGLAPSVSHFADGILVSPFIDGKTLTNRDLQHPPMLKRIASSLRLLHEARERLTGELLFFCPFQTVRTYVETARRLGASLPSSIECWINDSTLLQREIGAFHPTLCHNDLLAANLMDDGEQLWIVDWEYAGIGNPLFDLASVSINSGLSEDLETVLIHEYFGGINRKVLVELQILKAVSLLREALWAVIQTVMSNISFDYTAYAAEHFSAFETAHSQMVDALADR